jgi:predicted acyl esterase
VGSWSEIQPLAFHLHGDGTLDQSAPSGLEASRSFASPADSQSNGYRWQAPPTPGTYLSYTSAPLARNVDFLGPGSLNLWLSSTAPDTDLEATVSELRPDGSDQYIASGWLRVSERKLDLTQSTVLRPVQTHTQADQSFLTPGVPVYARVEIFPFEHAFPAGSQIELTIDTAAGPAGAADDYRGFAAPPPAADTIYQDATHDSELVLGQVPGTPAIPAEPACGKVTSEPCRSALP